MSSAKPSSTSSSEKSRKNVQDNAKTGSQANNHKHQQKPNINLRNKTTSHGKVARLFQNFNYSPTKWSKEMLGRDMNISKWYPVLCLNAWQRILSYDEHQLSYQHKFGIIYQKARQTNETDILANNSESSAFSEFLNQIGEVVQLKGFKGFRGGLDISANNTGSRSLYRVFNERHIMFHVSTMLPFNTRDSQQVQRKRFIGNDLVTVVFQDSATPFSPTLLKTNYIHCYIVLQPIESCTPRVRYKMSICSREGVPDFGPALPEPPIFEPGEYFQKFLLCKLINAEIACSQAGRFGKLNDRTRTSLLFSLYDDLKKSTENLCGVKIDNGTGVTKGMDHKAGKSPRTVQRELISANHSKFFDALRIFRGSKKNQENSMPETEESSIDLSQNGSINDKDKSEKSEKSSDKKKVWYNKKDKKHNFRDSDTRSNHSSNLSPDSAMDSGDDIYQPEASMTPILARLQTSMSKELTPTQFFDDNEIGELSRTMSKLEEQCSLVKRLKEANDFKEEIKVIKHEVEELRKASKMNLDKSHMDSDRTSMIHSVYHASDSGVGISLRKPSHSMPGSSTTGHESLAYDSGLVSSGLSSGLSGLGSGTGIGSGHSSKTNLLRKIASKGGNLGKGGNKKFTRNSEDGESYFGYPLRRTKSSDLCDIQAQVRQGLFLAQLAENGVPPPPTAGFSWSVFKGGKHHLLRRV